MKSYADRYVVDTTGDIPSKYDPNALFTSQHRRLYESYIRHLQVCMLMTVRNLVPDLILTSLFQHSLKQAEDLCFLPGLVD